LLWPLFTAWPGLEMLAPPFPVGGEITLMVECCGAAASIVL
jgi:hypothetical protein